MRNILIILAAVLMFGCKTQRHTVTEVPIQYREKIVERLVPVEIADDSLLLSALFECDSTNQVILKQLQESKSKGVESNFTVDNGKLTYTAKAKHDTIYLPSKEITITKEVPVKVEVVKEVNHLSWWQTGQIHLGRLFLTILMGYGFYKLLKWKLKLI